MQMSYTKNPYLPKVRQDTADLVRKGWGVRKVARYVGVSPGTVTKWVKKAQMYGYHPIPTLSSKPKHHPKQLSDDVVWKIFHKRLLIKRSAEVVQQELVNEGVPVSLSSVKRTLDRLGLLKKRSPWKRYHIPIIRPEVKSKGDLVQIDTIHLLSDEGHRVYIFTLLDIYSRWAWAKAYKRATSNAALQFLKSCQKQASFQFKVVQSDNGSEFAGRFSENISSIHRHTRVRRPNDNAHLERFNRTLQEECLDKIPRKIGSINSALRKYLPYYNEKRLHFGLKLQTPLQVLTGKCFQAID
jgi:transposase InsO family protein